MKKKRKKKAPHDAKTKCTSVQLKKPYNKTGEGDKK